MDTENNGTHQKARQINLDSARHGAFAEIGAGQEVARWFFQVVGRLFKSGVRLYVYPLRDSNDGDVITAENLSMPPNLKSLYGYLLENGYIEAIRNVDPNRLNILPREVLAKIQRGDPSWDSMVPLESAQMVKDHRFFGYRTPRDQNG